jgi:hypothetical protein
MNKHMLLKHALVVVRPSVPIQLQSSDAFTSVHLLSCTRFRTPETILSYHRSRSVQALTVCPEVRETDIILYSG